MTDTLKEALRELNDAAYAAVRAANRADQPREYINKLKQMALETDDIFESAQ